MYDRRLNGEILSFGHAGILYENSFVMYDRRTESLWVHVTGRAAVGVQKGNQLQFIPSTVTSWKKWQEAYPDTLVLGGHRRSGFMGTYEGLSQHNNQLGLVVLVKFKGKLYPFKVIKHIPVINDQFNGKAILVYYSQKEKSAAAWVRTVDGKVLTFEPTHQKDKHGNRLLRDQQTQSLWSWLTGAAVAGKLKGRKLAQLSYNPILNERFFAFYPAGSVYQ